MNKFPIPLETAAELIRCTEEYMCKLSFDVKRYLHYKEKFYPVNMDYFLSQSCTTTTSGWLLQVNDKIFYE